MHFALVHGAYHGAWCWEQLRRELERDGHTTSAVNLPCEDPEAGAERYADEVVHSMPKTTEGVVLVVHSLAGLTIPVVAGRTKTLMTVYLCALVPMPGLSFDAQAADLRTGFVPSEGAISHPDGSASWPERGAIESFFHDCDPEIAHAAARRLRKQYWLVTQEVTPLRRWPDSPAAYILCTDDRVIPAGYSRRAARDQLGVGAVEMGGGHPPVLSRPRELATLLEGLVE